MNCVVTAGPTYEPLDKVRRLTNWSTGQLGTELANFLVERGHVVTLLLGQQATWPGEGRAQLVQRFTTTSDLRARLRTLADSAINAVFHAAAVNDFAFGRVWTQLPNGERQEVKHGKIPTAVGGLLAELVPTPKIISDLRGWFPTACLIGWKYEVDGDRGTALVKGAEQIRLNRTDACVLNGPAYGPGFGLLRRGGECHHLAGRPVLFAALERLADLEESGDRDQGQRAGMANCQIFRCDPRGG